MGIEEKQLLNQLAGKILRDAGLVFEEWKDFDWIAAETGDVGYGYANFYLVECWNEMTKNNEADASVYRQLVDIDSKLASEYSRQLFCCLAWTTRWAIIEVWLNNLNISF